TADSLDTLIRDYGPAPAADAARVATELAAALDFAAAVGVYHGALHPRDVLVGPDDARLNGVGIVQALERVGVAPPVRPPYTAPERPGAPPGGAAADLFSLAAIVQAMLRGRPAPASRDVAAELAAMLPACDVDKLRMVFRRAAAEDPALRFPTALKFAES